MCSQKRSNEIGEAFNEMVDQLGYDTTAADLRDIAAIDTRDDKIPTSIEELLAGWTTQAEAAGLDRDRISNCFGQPGVVIEHLEMIPTPRCTGFGRPLHASPNPLSVFTRVDVIQSVTRWRRTDADGLPFVLWLTRSRWNVVTDRYLASQQVVTLVPLLRHKQTQPSSDPTAKRCPHGRSKRSPP